MIPDFSTMSGARVASTEDAEVAAGIARHHAGGSAVHQLPVSSCLMRGLDGRLLARGCARGPPCAVAHIGVELLLEGVLLAEPAYRDSYLRGIAYDASITWR